MQVPLSFRRIFQKKSFILNTKFKRRTNERGEFMFRRKLDLRNIFINSYVMFNYINNVITIKKEIP